jgi:small subunit ribosomal protein S20
MANIKSQIKRNRQALGRRMRNKSVRARLKTLTRSFLDAAESGDADRARETYRLVAREYDKAASKGIIHRNKAANQKARLAKRLNQAS